MLFIKVDNARLGIPLLVDKLNKSLSSKSSVTWLLSGGSNIRVEIEAFKQLSEPNLRKLTVLLADERYGPPNHPDSNYFQLKKAGFNFEKIKSVPVLSDSSLSLKKTTLLYAKQVKNIFSQSGMIIGQFGIGSNGHTAGILPNSEATISSDSLVIGYKASDFSRISLTFSALMMVDCAFVFAFGEERKPALTNLANNKLALEDQPSQVFRQIKETYIINDVIGDKL